MGKKVYNAGYDMGDNAINAVSNAIARISDVVNSDVDSQPTIRPVMDLDDVRSGMDTMNRMLGATPSVGVLANVNAIRSSMNRGQNGQTMTLFRRLISSEKMLETLKISLITLETSLTQVAMKCLMQLIPLSGHL